MSVLTAASKRAPQPEGCTISLWPHQLAALHACHDVEQNSRVRAGVMCDRPGAGKTNVLLALALSTARSSSRRQSTIIVVPHNILSQWRDAATNFAAPGLLSVGVIDSYPPVAAMLHRPAAVLNAHDIIITTTLYFNTIATALHGSGVMAHRLVFDEVDSVAGMMQNAFPAKFTWFVSATAVENFVNTTNVGAEQRKYVSTAASAVQIRCEDAFVDASITLPEPEHSTIVLENVIIDNVLAGVLSRNEMGALNAMCFDHILLSKATTVIASNEAEAVRALLDDSAAIAEHARVREREIATQLAERSQFMTDLSRTATEYDLKHVQKLAQTHESRIATITQRLADNVCCPICISPVEGDRLVTRCCNKTFCEPCMRSWNARSSSCPTCRATINGVVVIQRTPTETASDDDVVTVMRRMTNKIEALGVLLKTKMKNGRIILFSDFQATFKQAAILLRRLGLTYTELDGGNVRELDAAQQDFRSGRAQVLLVNSAFYGAGMNLECATDVVFMHSMAPHMEKQVIGRAQRPGRTCQLAVWSLLYKNEVA